jgi:flavin-dependent dehydrogenase
VPWPRFSSRNRRLCAPGVRAAHSRCVSGDRGPAARRAAGGAGSRIWRAARLHETRHRPGWALVGDAAYFKDPLTAHGITDALRDAELLARAAVRGTSEAFAGYEAVRSDLSDRLFEVTDEVASFAWTDVQLQALHLALSSEMTRESSLPRCPRAFSDARDVSKRRCRGLTREFLAARVSSVGDGWIAWRVLPSVSDLQ